MSRFTLFVCILFITSLLTSPMAMAQKPLTPEQVVQANLDSYNQRDIDGFMLAFSDDIAIFTFPDAAPTTVGREAVRQLYAGLFQRSPELHSNIVNRITFDNKVIDHESIVGRNGSPDILELVLIYEVRDEKIFRITVIRK